MNLRGTIIGIPKGLLASFILVSLFFYFVPQVDLWVSGLFYKSDSGFYLDKMSWVRFVYQGIPVLTVFMVVCLVVAILFTWIGRRNLCGLGLKVYVYLLLVLSLGPGLLSAIFKDYWGRARPESIVQFGGHNHFSAAYQMVNECGVNCSFFSGHPTTIYFFIAVALIVPMRYRRMVMSSAILGGLFVGLVRVVQGGHFLSDIVISGFMVAVTAYILHWLMFTVWGRNSPDESSK